MSRIFNDLLCQVLALDIKLDLCILKILFISLVRKGSTNMYIFSVVLSDKKKIKQLRFISQISPFTSIDSKSIENDIIFNSVVILRIVGPNFVDLRLE